MKIKIFINAQQWKDIQGGHQQVRGFNQFLEDRVKKKKDQVVAGKPGKSKAQKIHEEWISCEGTNVPVELLQT